MYKHWENQKKTVLETIGKTQSITCQVCYGTNYSIFFRNLHSDLLLKKNLLPVYVDLNHLYDSSNKSIYHLILISIKRAMVEKKLTSKVETPNLTESELKDYIENVVKDVVSKKLNIVFFLEDLDTVLGNGTELFVFLENLKSVHLSCSFIFIVRANLNHPTITKKLSQHKNLYENLIYMQIRTEADIKASESGTSPKIFTRIYKLTGGIDRFHGVAMDLKNNIAPRERKNIEKYILSNWHLKKEASILWDSLSESELELLSKIVWKAKNLEQTNKHDLDHFLRLGLVTKDRTGYIISVGILKSLGVEKHSKLGNNLEFVRNKVLINGNNVFVKLTPAEKRVLKEFLINKNKIVGKVQIAKSIWNGSHSKKYNDKSIDSVVSGLRNKLSEVWVSPSSLVPVENRGFIYREDS